MALYIRTNTDRVLMECGYANSAVRIHIFKTGAAKSDKDNILVKTVREDILKNSVNAMGEYFNKAESSENNCPERAFIYDNKNDKYFSILLAYKLRKKNEVRIADLRYKINEVLSFKGFHVLYVNNYETHKNLGGWDVEHAMLPPSISYDRVEIQQICFSEEKTIENREEKPVKNSEATTVKNQKNNSGEGGGE